MADLEIYTPAHLCLIHNQMKLNLLQLLLMIYPTHLSFLNKKAASYQSKNLLKMMTQQLLRILNNNTKRSEKVRTWRRLLSVWLTWRWETVLVNSMPERSKIGFRMKLNNTWCSSMRRIQTGINKLLRHLQRNWEWQGQKYTSGIGITKRKEKDN